MTGLLMRLLLRGVPCDPYRVGPYRGGVSVCGGRFCADYWCGCRLVVAVGVVWCVGVDVGPVFYPFRCCCVVSEVITPGMFVTVGRESLVWVVVAVSPSGQHATIRSGLSGRTTSLPVFRLKLFPYPPVPLNPIRELTHV